MLYRVYDENGKAIADLIACRDEVIKDGEEIVYIDPKQPWKKSKFTGCHFKPLQTKIFDNGIYVGEKKTVKEISDYVKKQLDNEIWEEEQRFENPHTHYLDMTPKYYKMKCNLL